MGIEVFERYESSVRSYCRKYPVVFEKAKNAELFSENGDRYIDFLAVAGSMNYGHNNPYIKKAVLDYLESDSIINALDMYTTAKEDFINAFVDKILTPRQLDYKIMCCGPTGTNAVEAALKLARKNTGRTGVFAFSGAYHGMTLGSLAVTSDRVSRHGAGVPLCNTAFIPYCGDRIDTITYLTGLLEDDHSGVDVPAAIILETVQAEGGINVATAEWLKEIERICREYSILLIVDDIQVGVGRTGRFFSFEEAGIYPDMVVLSKSISGFGMPMSLLLVRPQYDIFKPAEHNGTFRGNQLSFVGASAAIEYYLANNLGKKAQENGAVIRQYLTDQILSKNEHIKLRGKGMIWGLDFNEVEAGKALEIVHKAFDQHLILEVAGRNDNVLKIMPPLTIQKEKLREGLEIIKQCLTQQK